MILVLAISATPVIATDDVSGKIDVISFAFSLDNVNVKLIDWQKQADVLMGSVYLNPYDMIDLQIGKIKASKAVKDLSDIKQQVSDNRDNFDAVKDQVKGKVDAVADYLGEVIPADVTYTCTDGQKVGDTNNDGLINGADAKMALEITVGLNDTEIKNICCADVSKDGTISAYDASFILQGKATGTCGGTNQNKPLVILVLDKNLYNDPDVKMRFDRYESDNKDYEFKEMIFDKKDTPVTDMQSAGGEIKSNSLELRNSIKQIYTLNKDRLKGVYIIGNIRPTIWRDSKSWRDLGTSSCYPSVYPLISFGDEYYNNFDAKNDCFYEKPGVTRGSEVGGGNSASIWGAVLIPPTRDYATMKELIINFFDRDHGYRTKNIIYDNKMLYSDIFGCSSDMLKKVESTPFWGSGSTELCPNFNSQLTGFSSQYMVLIHNRGSDYDPIKVGFSGINAASSEEEKEFTNWINTDYFGKSSFTKSGGPYDYFFILHLEGRSLSTEEIKGKIEESLPSKICSRIGACRVYVLELGFYESSTDGTWNGNWNNYPLQRDAWTSLYDNAMKNNKFTFAYISAHGAPTYHIFGISSDKVKNSGYSSLIYQLESCNTGNYLVDDYLAGNYLFYGNALAVSAYSIPFVLQGRSGYFEQEPQSRFLRLNKNDPVIDTLFLKNYGNYIYLGDPLLKIQ